MLEDHMNELTDSPLLATKPWRQGWPTGLPEKQRQVPTNQEAMPRRLVLTDDGRKSWMSQDLKAGRGGKKSLHPMEPPSSPSSTITIAPNCHEFAQRSGKLIAEAMTCRFALLHYDSASKSMVEWCWPADGEGKKIPPSDFEKSREEYNFQYPCCLCAGEGGKEAYVEAAVYPWWDSITKKTRWTARCVSDTCGYQVKIDMHFRLAPLAALQYPRREQRIPPVQLEWTDREQTELLNRLASSDGDGIAASEFRILF
ncbi:hypothetical protein F4604DRAFT_1928154 [Suillus subluteus]|nr:hypothetical protein F4604DRAFT_1928154 [Suillus subluteus]